MAAGVGGARSSWWERVSPGVGRAPCLGGGEPSTPLQHPHATSKDVAGGEWILVVLHRSHQCGREDRRICRRWGLPVEEDANVGEGATELVKGDARVGRARAEVGKGATGIGEEEGASGHGREQGCGEDGQEAHGGVRSPARRGAELSQRLRRCCELFFFFLEIGGERIRMPYGPPDLPAGPSDVDRRLNTSITVILFIMDTYHSDHRIK